MTTAREFAVDILRRWEVLHNPPFVPERGDAVWTEVPPRERPLAFDLLTGVIRWRGALDAVIASRLRQPIDSLEIGVRAILWVGTFQLLLQSGAADYAAVDSAVTLAHQKQPRAAGLVNAVLRGITRLMPRQTPINPSLAPLRRLFRRSLALDFQTQVLFNTDIFPDPVRDLTAHLAAVRSHPPELVAHVRRLIGDAACAELLLADNQRPVITLRADAKELSLPAAAGLVAHTLPQFLIASDGWNPALEALIRAGTLSPQDPAAAKPVRHFAEMVAGGKIPAPTNILDLCAGLGTKTVQLARAFPDVQITAADIDSVKLKRLESRATAIGQKNISLWPLRAIENQKSKIENDSVSTHFDAVLVDAPCSNTGVLARRVQSRWRWPKLDHAGLAALQSQLLEQAAGLLAPAGTLIYSTCSVDPAENQELVGKFLAGHPGFRRIAEESTLPAMHEPQSPHDGGYFAILTNLPRPPS